MQKFLRIDVGRTGGPSVTVSSPGAYAGLGGRAMTSAVVATEVPPDSNPLGPENKLVIAPGLLSGSAASTSGRLSVGCKSPLTGTIKEANSGGTAAQALGRLGYAAVVIEGERQGDDLYRVVIDMAGARIEKCNEYRMLTNYALADKVKAEFGADVSLLSIGTAGEMRMANSTIAVTDVEFRPSRHAGRGGVGAVMGSKGIKCLIMNPAGTTLRSPAAPAVFEKANRKFVEGLRKHSVTGQGLPMHGTSILASVLSETEARPSFDFREERYADTLGRFGEVQAMLETRRGVLATCGCHHGCAIQCTGAVKGTDGNYIPKQPEYETTWAHGGNCGIADLEQIAKLGFLDDNYGMDTIEMGATISVAMEAGIIPFGDGEGAIRLVHEAGQGTPLGRILGAGTAVTAKCLGLEHVPAVTRPAVSAHDLLTAKGFGPGRAAATTILKVGGDEEESQTDLSRDLQVATAALDATGFCLFVAFAILDQPETFEAMVGTINGMYGLSMTTADVVALGRKILTMEREFNEKAGFTTAHDQLPRYPRREPASPHGVAFNVPDQELDSAFNF